MKLQCLIIDDEPLARERLNKLVRNTPDLELLAMCKTGKEAIAMIEQHEPDLIFLDIQMKDLNGFQVLEAIEEAKRPLVIFVTAYDQYAIKAFDYYAFDYLLKPFKKERFLQSVERILLHLKNNGKTAVQERLDRLLEYINDQPKLQSQKPTLQKLPIRIGNSISFIDWSSINYIVAAGSYANIHIDKKVIVQRASLSKLLEGFDSMELLRIHRSTIVNINNIKKVIHQNHSELEVEMSDGKIFRVSKSYKKELQNRLGI